MEAVIAVVLVVGFAVFLLRGDPRYMAQRRRKKLAESPVKADPRVIALLIEQQAKIDLQTFAVRLLIKTHPQAHQLEGVIRSAAPEFVKVQSVSSKDSNAAYARAIELALDSLLSD